MADMDVLIHCVAIIFAVLSVTSGVNDDEFDGLSTLVVEHSFDSGPSPVFARRGTISIQSVTAGSAYFTPDTGLPAGDRDRLRDLATTDGEYLIRVGSKAVGSGDGQMEYVYTFVKACALLESKLTDIITIHVDSSGSVFAVSMEADIPYCTNQHVHENDIKDFNTSVYIKQSVSGPVPDTQSFVTKMEAEQAERTKGAQGDNRSFLAKYWMYIVPVFLVLMFANSAGDQAGGGGGR